jgi:hypothetical protein
MLPPILAVQTLAISSQLLDLWSRVRVIQKTHIGNDKYHRDVHNPSFSLGVTVLFFAALVWIQLQTSRSASSFIDRCQPRVLGGSKPRVNAFLTRSRPQPNPAARALIEIGTCQLESMKSWT